MPFSDRLLRGQELTLGAGSARHSSSSKVWQVGGHFSKRRDRLCLLRR